MTRIARHLLLGLGLGGGVTALGTYWLLAQEKPFEPPIFKGRPGVIAPPGAGKAEPPPPPPSGPGFGVPTPAIEIPGRPATYSPAGAESKPDKSVPPVKVTDQVAKTAFAVEPKPLSEAVKKGLKYLVEHQQPDGGWNQGGGWRTNLSGGGRIDGPNVADPSDVGNTAFAMLALIRAGNTPVEGEYKDAVRKGLEFLLKHVEKADNDSLYVSDIRGTQLQSKIGPYVDTFMANLVLAELRGRCGNLEPRVVTALEKTMTKIVRHQGADGNFAGNNAWAPTLSVGIANKSVARARERGAQVDEIVLKRIVAQAKTAAQSAGRTGGVTSTAVPGVEGPGRPGGARTIPAAAGDAGIALYSASQGASNFQDVVNNIRLDAAKAKEVLKSRSATTEQKGKRNANWLN